MLCHPVFRVFTAVKPEFYFVIPVFSPNSAEIFCVRLPG